MGRSLFRPHKKCRLFLAIICLFYLIFLVRNDIPTFSLISIEKATKTDELITNNRQLIINSMIQSVSRKDNDSKSLKQSSNGNEPMIKIDANQPTVKPTSFSDTVESILGDDVNNISFIDKTNININWKNGTNPKIIITWNAGHGQEHLSGCPDWHCILTSDRSKINQAEAIILASADTTVESPVHSWINAPIPNFFNLSLGYRRDSLISSPYGYTVRLAQSSFASDVRLPDHLLRNKTKPIAWFVSHCQTASGRESYVAALKKYIDIDIFGSCPGSNKVCTRDRESECDQLLRTTYRFYLAFENSICRDYITEKYWDQGNMDIVPIVLERSIVEPYAPPKSFIAVDDFATVKQLADYLKSLMINDTAYQSYFDWRREYKIVFLDGKVHDVRERPWGFCQLCRLLWQQPRQTHIIDNIADWWSKKSACHPTHIVDQ